MHKILFILALVAITAINSGCAIRPQIVPYGVEEMGQADKDVVQEILTNLPRCQRWTWENDQRGRKYTMMWVESGKEDINTQYKIFSLDTVYITNSQYRKNKRVVGRAFKKSYNTLWDVEPTDQILGFEIGSDLRVYTQRNVDTMCATRNDRRRRTM